MAQRVQVEMVDDLNGETAQKTVRFGIDGTDYEIDLTTENAEKLRSTLSKYVEKGRKSTRGKRGQGGRQPSPETSSTNHSKREETQQIRQWAKDNGYNPNSRGRITKSIVDAYNEAH